MSAWHRMRDNFPKSEARVQFLRTVEVPVKRSRGLTPLNLRCRARQSSNVRYIRIAEDHPDVFVEVAHRSGDTAHRMEQDAGVRHRLWVPPYLPRETLAEQGILLPRLHFGRRCIGKVNREGGAGSATRRSIDWFRTWSADRATASLCPSPAPSRAISRGRLQTAPLRSPARLSWRRTGPLASCSSERPAGRVRRGIGCSWHADRARRPPASGRGSGSPPESFGSSLSDGLANIPMARPWRAGPPRGFAEDACSRRRSARVVRSRKANCPKSPQRHRTWDRLAGPDRGFRGRWPDPPRRVARGDSASPGQV